MTYRLLFRLSLRVVGVLVIADAVPNLVYRVLRHIVNARQGSDAGFSDVLVAFSYPVVYLAIGAYLLLRGSWLVNLVFPCSGPFCRECGLRLREQTTQGTCPDCGTPFALPSQGGAE